jgi:hypothetical protein
MQYVFPLTIPEPLKLKASRLVFFRDASVAGVKIICALSKELADKGSITLLLRAGKKLIASQSYKAAKGNAFLKVPLKGLPDGFYSLTAELKFNNKTYCYDQIQLMLVPGY